MRWETCVETNKTRRELCKKCTIVIAFVSALAKGKQRNSGNWQWRETVSILLLLITMQQAFTCKCLLYKCKYDV